MTQHRQPQAEAEDDQRQRKGGDDPGGGLVRQLQAHGVVDVRRADQRTGHEHREPGVATGPPACLAQGDRGGAGDQENGVEDAGVQPRQYRRDPGGQGDVAGRAIGQDECGGRDGQDADHHGDVREHAANVAAPRRLLFGHREEPFIGTRCPFFAVETSPLFAVETSPLRCRRQQRW